jgi:uncharacterized protein (TIGR03437 family)
MSPTYTCFVIFSSLALAQGTINTYAGADDLFTGSGQPATAAHLLGPTGVAVDGQGNVYIADPALAIVLKVAAGTGVITIAAGNGLATFAGDGGAAAGASLSHPTGVVVDSAGNLFIADPYNSNIRKVDTNGIITTVAGAGGQAGFSGDGGLATKALLNSPNSVAVDKLGNLYIVDFVNQRVRMLSAGTGVITTIAGNGNLGTGGDGGPATSASLDNPVGIAVDSAGNVYVSDAGNCAVREISGGIMSTIAGTLGKCGFAGDGSQANKAMLSFPDGVAVDASGNIYIADTANQRIRRVTGGNISTIAGTSTAGFSGDGAAAALATFSSPQGVAVDASGNIYVADVNNNRVRRFVPGGNIATFAGTATSIGDGGPSTQAILDQPASVAVDSSGNLYIADTGENRIRKVTPSGTITTIVGNGQAGRGGDNGPAASATLSSPSGVAVDAAGNLYIADAGNNVIRKVTASTGVISAFAGNYGCCYAGTGTGGDGGLATAATLLYPEAVAVDGAGNVYFTDIVQSTTSPEAVAVRRVTTDGKINTWAGGGTVVGFAGDGGSPLLAQFGDSINIAAGADGSLYIADASNQRVRKVDPAGATINTVAGNGQGNPSGDGGAATSAGVQLPFSVAVDAAGNIYIGGLTTVRKVTTGGTISTYAGNGQPGFSGDGGPATSASVSDLTGLVTDSGNNLYIADRGNNRIRQVQPAAPPVINLSSTSINFSGAVGAPQTFTVSNSGQGTLHWSAAASSTSGGTWLTVAPASGSVLAGQPAGTVTVTANSSGLAGGDYYAQIFVTSPNAASPLQSITVRLTVQAAGEVPPQVAAGGVLNGASFSLATPVAPGTLVSIFGSGFTDSAIAIVAESLPWANQLGGTSVTIGGEPVPLYVVSAGQINGILPFDLPVNTSLPLVVIRNNAVSAPLEVSMVSSQPGVFTQSANGQGIGIVVVVHPDGSQVESGNGNSATAGDTLVIYCTGLGDVTPRAIAGTPAPASPLASAIDTVTLTIGGVNVPVAFAGPTPGFTGLYQVNATLPTAIAASQQAPLVLSQGGRASVAVTVPVQ